MWRRVAKIVLSVPFLIVAALFGLYLAAGFFLVNPLAQKLLPWVGENTLASRLEAAQVRFNPLTLELTVRDLRLAEMDGSPLAGFERLYVNLDTTGLARWAWRIRDLQLERPQAVFAVRPGGALNWQALLDKLGEDPQPPSDTLARLLVDHVRIADGNVDYSDANRPGKPFRVVLAPLGLELDGLSTLPEDRGDYSLAARLPEQGGTLKWKGDIGLNPVASKGVLGLEGVRVAQLLRALKSPRNFDVPSGTLAAGLNYRFAMVRGREGDDVPWLRVSGANLLLRDLALTPAGGGEPLLQLAEARVGDAGVDLASRRIEVASVRLAGGELAATRAADGSLDWQTLFAAADPPVAAAAAAPPAGPAAEKTAAGPAWSVAVREIALAGWTARYTDRGYATPLALSVEDFGLAGALAGTLGATTALVVGPVDAALGPLRVRSGSREVATLARAALVDANLALAEKQLEIEAIELSGLRTDVQRDRNRTLNWGDILKKAPGAPVAAPAAPPAEDRAPRFGLKLARLALDGVDIGIADASTPTPVRLDLTRGHLTLRDLSLDLDQAVPVEAGFALGQGGSVSARGSVTPGKSSGRLDLRLAGLALKPLAPYVNQFARLKLDAGTASTRGRLAFAAAESGLRLDYAGAFSVDGLAITEEDTGDPFLGWKRLASDSLDFGLGPDRLRMKELVASNAFGKVIIFEDQSVNLRRILRDAPDKKSAAADKPATADKPMEAPAFPVTIARVRIVDADAEFADLSLNPQFGTRMHALSGVVTGLSSDPATVAQVELDGKVDEYGSARVRGSIQPFEPTEFTDLTLAFRNLEMAKLSPYSGKFAGRRIDSGKLSVDLEYKIKARQLAGENKFIVNRLRLGERVDSPDAVNLPLDLAIALLEDGNGVIDLDLPVSGSLDDPQFSYGKIVWKAIVNVLTKLVTAPFRALGKLLGVSPEQFEAVGFDPGSSALLPPEQEKLKTLAEALARRPALTLTLVPGYDPEADRRALQVQAVRLDAARAAGIELAAGEAPGPVDVNNNRIRTWLEDRTRERIGKDEYQKLRAGFQDKDAGAAARIMESEAVERLARRFKTREDGPPSAFHAELLERLVAATAIDDARLVALAQARGEAMRQALLGLGIDPGRVAVAAAETRAQQDKFVASTLRLGAGKPAPAGTASAPAAP